MTDAAPRIELRNLQDADLDTLFAQQQDHDANHMAAFVNRDPADRAAFDAHWARIRADETVTIQAILCDGAVAGSVLSFEMFGDLEVSYWLGREFWGRGVATRGLSAFLEHQPARPLHAHVARDNLGSIRVLEKCGFVVTATEKGFARYRGVEVEEFVMKLEGDAT